METSSRRRLVQSSTLGAGALLALALLVIVNYLGGKYYARFDWTSSEIYTLSEKSLNVVRALEDDVEAIVLMSPMDPLYGPTRELLSRYEAASQRMTTRYVDPEKNLVEARSLVERFELAQLNVVVFAKGDDRRVVDGSDLADYDFSGMQFGQEPQMTGYKGEQVFTSTLLDLSESAKPKVLFTTGHGELELSGFGPQGLDAARQALEGDNFEVESWASLGQTAVPEGVALVVVAGPTASFIEPEAAVLGEYLAGGGRLLLLLDPALSPSGALAATGLEGLLADWGVEVGADIVIDPANPLPFYGAETIFVDSYGSHPITRSLDQTRVPVILPLARSVAAAADAEGLEVVELLKTTSDGWGETDLDDLDGGVEKGDADLAGPVPVAVAVRLADGDEEEPDVLATDPLEVEPHAEPDAEPETGESTTPTEPETVATDESRLVVFGDSDFVSNGQVQNAGNAALFLNAINWLTERENLVGIAPKKPEQVRLSLTSAQIRDLTVLVFVLLPGAAIAMGTVVFFRRRR